MAKAISKYYDPKNCLWCEKELNITITDNTILDVEEHDGIYKDKPQDWYPHYDVEYFCHGDCEYYEHYTHNVDGTLIGMRVNKVFYNFENRQFSIVEGTIVTPVGRLPDGVEFGSEIFGKFLDEVLKIAYSE